MTAAASPGRLNVPKVSKYHHSTYLEPKSQDMGNPCKGQVYTMQVLEALRVATWRPRGASVRLGITWLELQVMAYLYIYICISYLLTKERERERERESARERERETERESE